MSAKERYKIAYRVVRDTFHREHVTSDVIEMVSLCGVDVSRAAMKSYDDRLIIDTLDTNIWRRYSKKNTSKAASKRFELPADIPF